MSTKQPTPQGRSSIFDSIEIQLKRLSADLRLEELERVDAQLRDVPDDLASPELIGCLVHICMLWVHAGEASRAKAVSDKGIRWATLLADPHSLRRALNMRAFIATDMLDISAAISNLTQALEVAEVSNDLLGIVTSYHNISVNCHYLNMTHMARQFAATGIDILRERSSELRTEDAQLYECILEYSLALAQLQIGDLRTAIRTLRDVQNRGERILPRLEARDHLQLTAYLHNARCSELVAAVRLGMLDEARRLAALIQVGPTSAITNKCALDTRRALAELSAAEGHIQEAVTELEDMLQDPRANSEKPTIGLSIAHCYNKLGRHSDAIATLRRMDVDVRLARSMVAIDKLRSISPGQDEPDISFERDLIDRASRFDIAREAARTDRLSRFAALIAMAISAELDETDQLDGMWHAIRVGALARLVASASGAEEKDCYQAEVAGWLHDLGKCVIPDHLKLKASPLSEEERQLVREHSEFGARLFEALGEADFELAVAGVRHHHERFDGKGYPSRLTGDQIPWIARVITLCDSFDAMMLRRRFRSALTLDEAVREVENQAGQQFDPVLATTLVPIVRELETKSGGALRQLELLGKASAPVESFERLEMRLKSRS